MEVTDRQVERALIRLGVYREARDGMPDESVDTGTWHERWRWETAVDAIEQILDDLGIDHD